MIPHYSVENNGREFIRLNNNTFTRLSMIEVGKAFAEEHPNLEDFRSLANDIIDHDLTIYQNIETLNSAFSRNASEGEICKLIYLQATLKLLVTLSCGYYPFKIMEWSNSVAHNVTICAASFWAYTVHLIGSTARIRQQTELIDAAVKASKNFYAINESSFDVDGFAHMIKNTYALRNIHQITHRAMVEFLCERVIPLYSIDELVYDRISDMSDRLYLTNVEQISCSTKPSAIKMRASKCVSDYLMDLGKLGFSIYLKNLSDSSIGPRTLPECASVARCVKLYEKVAWADIDESMKYRLLENIVSAISSISSITNTLDRATKVLFKPLEED